MGEPQRRRGTEAERARQMANGKRQRSKKNPRITKIPQIERHRFFGRREADDNVDRD